MQQVFLVRHGETKWNIDRRIQGQSDSPLTEAGEWQARQVALRLKSLAITHIISSDLGRTKQTAGIIAEICGCPIIEDADLRELNMGVLESRYLQQLNHEEESWRNSLLNGDPNGRIPGGESMQELAMRMRQALDRCLDFAAGSKPVVVSHGLALGCLLSTIMGLPAYAERRLRLRNASLSRVDYQKSDWLAAGWIVESSGDIAHLME
jgi:2,3-bisphosphoglycerate-dependent phosphoglycerate mutase